MFIRLSGSAATLVAPWHEPDVARVVTTRVVMTRAVMKRSWLIAALISLFSPGYADADCSLPAPAVSAELSRSAELQALETRDEYVRRIETQRRMLNQAFRDPALSPLLPGDLARFETLDFYPIDTCYALLAAFHTSDGKQTFELPTFDGGSQQFVELGRLSFAVPDGSMTQLKLFQRADLGAFGELTAIAPFRDQTNGTDTYSGGRYLKFLLPLDQPVMVDFNRAVNPACAYNPTLPCPIPPQVNWLPFAVPAGERAFVSSEGS